MSKEQNNMIVKIIAIVAVVGIAYMLINGGNSGGGGIATGEIKIPGSSSGDSDKTVKVVQAASTKVDLGTKKGIYSLTPTDQNGGTPTGTSSTMLLLKKEYWLGDPESTRHSIMKKLGDGSAASLKYYNGAQESKTHSSGTWSWNVAPKAYRLGNDIFSDDQAVLFVYFDDSPIYGENRSYAKLLSFDTFTASTETWSASFEDDSTTLKLTSYAKYNITNNNLGQVTAYVYGDGGSILLNKGITWNSNASTTGEECVDCAIFVTAPENYTNVFKSLTLTATSVKYGDSTIKFTSGDLVYNGYPDNIAKIANIIPSGNGFDKKWFVGYIPAGFNTERTSTDNKEVTWKITTDTFGVPVNTTWYIVQNAHALDGNVKSGVINTFTNGYQLRYTTDPNSASGAV